MFRHCLLALVAAFSFPVTALQDNESAGEAAPSHYVREDLFIYLHTGPGRNYRIVGSINAGAPLTLVTGEDENAFTHIVDNDGREGWIESRYLSTSPSSALLVPALQSELASSQSKARELQDNNSQLASNLAALQQQVDKLNAHVAEQNAQIQQLNTTIQSAENEAFYTWFKRGAMVAFGGMVFGVLVTMIPKRRRRQSEWA